MQIITLTTDFGTKDWFTGVLKGKILQIAKDTQVIDVSHNLESFNIAQAAFFLKNFYKEFPKNTIHCAVIDPTVGSKRKIIAVKTNNYYFVAPDNGLLSYIFLEEEIIQAVEIPVPKDSSTTFHGRDIFAPTAAKIALNPDLSLLGKDLKTKPITLELNSPKISENILTAEVIFIDKFGNIILNIHNKMWNAFFQNKPDAFFTLHIEDKKYILRYVDTYADGKENEILLIKGSCGYIEIALNCKNAAEKLKAENNTKIKIEKTGNR